METVKEARAETENGALWLSLEKPDWESRSEAAEEWVAYLVGAHPYILDDTGEVAWVRRFAEQNALPFGLYQVGPTSGRRWLCASPYEHGVLLGCTDIRTLDDSAEGFPTGWSGGLGIHIFQTEVDMRMQLQEWSDRTFQAGPTGGRTLYTIRIGFDGERIGLLPNRHGLGSLRTIAVHAAKELGYRWKE